MTKSNEILTFGLDIINYDNDLPFLITPSAGKHCMDNDPHRHNFYEIIYITSGKGCHIVDFEPYKIKPPQFFFVSPGQVHFWESSTEFEGHFIMFYEDFLIFPMSGLNNIEELSFFHTVGKSPELPLNKKHAEMMDDLLRPISNEYKAKEANMASVLRAYLHILIAQLQRLTNGNQNGGSLKNRSSLVRRFKHLVAENFLKGITVQDYADMMCVSSSHLGNTLKSMTGLTPVQLIHNEMILEAKRMLIHTELTVSEIGYRLNFEDPSYFSRFFKREVGVNPLQFQTEIRKKYQIFAE